ncbi:MAG: pyridoxamine 5'-phosphate oxidase family protein [Deltaproteobacteria bacterium]|nr:pyridoxamine 5'-phosphate oxidase family protein [Deltaproteobacteria bacterium]
MSHPVPPQLEERLLAAFADPVSPAYGQAATIGLDHTPQVRSVHWHYRPEREALAFNTNTQSAKWLEVASAPTIAGCYIDMAQGLQWRWDGSAERLDGGNSADHTFLQTMWETIRPDIRTTYWANYLHGSDTATLDAGVEIDRRCPTCGVILCLPSRWDVYIINLTDYSQGTRTIYTLTGTEWSARRVSLLHTKERPVSASA